MLVAWSSADVDGCKLPARIADRCFSTAGCVDIPAGREEIDSSTSLSVPERGSEPSKVAKPGRIKSIVGGDNVPAD